MLKITGLDDLQKDLKEMEDVLSELDCELGRVNFDPNDPASIEIAVQSVDRIVDERIGGYSGNLILCQLADQMKVTYRENIIQKAAEARLKPNEE